VHELLWLLDRKAWTSTSIRTGYLACSRAATLSEHADVHVHLQKKVDGYLHANSSVKAYRLDSPVDDDIELWSIMAGSLCQVTRPFAEH
jgi:hypothetical protein